MFNKRILAIIKRELREKLMSKAFILMTLLFPLLMFGGIGIQALLRGDEGNSNVVLITDTQTLLEAFQNELTTSESIKEGKITFTFKLMNKDSVDGFLSKNKTDLLEGKITGVLFVPASVMSDKKIEYYSKTPTNMTLHRRIEGPINKVLVDNYFLNKNLSNEDLDFARKGIDIEGFKVSKEENKKEEGYGNIILSYVFTFLLYISLLMTGSMMMQSVIEEKSNRIVEVMLSSVSPSELLGGKIIGSGITALAQMAIWLSPIILIISTTWIALPPEIAFSITMKHIVFLMLNFSLGLITYLGLFATVGAIFDNPQDAQSGMWPVMMLILIPFFIAFSMLENPNSPIANIASLLPFASIMIMPVKMTVVDVPIWQLILSLVINTLTIFAIFPVAGKIYRTGILIYGKKVNLKEILKWITYKN